MFDRLYRMISENKFTYITVFQSQKCRDIVLRYKSNEINAALEYVRNKYGSDYLNLFRMRKNTSCGIIDI